MESKQYTKDQVAKYNGANGNRCWIVLKGNVYDVTDYLEKHPGGRELLMEFAGTDATRAFEDFGHSSDAKKLLKKFEIGVLTKPPQTEKNEQTTSQDYQKNSENAKQRRKFLSIILGRCASA